MTDCQTVSAGRCRKTLVAIVMLCLLAAASSSPAKIYQYKKDGRWFFTDTPPADMPADHREMTETGAAAHSALQGTAELLADYPARNAIEKAAMATVAIETAVGYGSGFFISGAGHIVTNKHVVRIPTDKARQIDDYFSRMDDRAGEIRRRLDEEQSRLDAFAGELDQLQRSAAAENDASRKAAYADAYNRRKSEYDRWNADFQQRKAAFHSQLETYRDKRENVAYDRSVADLAQTFTVILVDDTTLYARLVAVSETHDLALLKVDGYRTPMLPPGASTRLAQGDAVYAIGNPARLRNTVTSGIFSGFEGGYLQTNAQISPGSSGGPLIDPEGKVLGVNTMKALGGAFEGLGFAIPIETVLAAFGGDLP